jgi:hypothetical protein
VKYDMLRVAESWMDCTSELAASIKKNISDHILSHEKLEHTVAYSSSICTEMGFWTNQVLISLTSLREFL